MTLDQLAEEIIYDGPIEECMEENTYECMGVLRVHLPTNHKTLNALYIGGITLDVSNITARVTIKDEVKAWNEDQARDFWWNILRNKKRQEVQEKLDEAGVDASVEIIGEEVWINIIN